MARKKRVGNPIEAYVRLILNKNTLKDGEEQYRRELLNAIKGLIAAK